jgi:hypothetical protein
LHCNNCGASGPLNNPGGAAPFESISERLKGITGYKKRKGANSQTFEILDIIRVQMIMLTLPKAQFWGAIAG